MTWVSAKRQKYHEQERKCAVCARPKRFQDLVGHHRNGRNGVKDVPSADDFELRCKPCERLCHEMHSQGNPDPEQARRQARCSSPSVLSAGKDGI